MHPLAGCANHVPLTLQARKDAGCSQHYLGMLTDCTYQVGGYMPAQFFAFGDPTASLAWRMAFA